MKYIKYLLFVVFISLACNAKIEWEDFNSIKNTIEIVRSKQHHKLIDTLKKKHNITYLNAFQIGMAHFELAEYKSATIWFAKSYFINKKEPNKHYPGVVYKYIHSLRNILYKKSPLAQDALYQIAVCYNQLKEKEYALKFLELLEQHETGELKEKTLELKASILVDKNPKMAKALYTKLLSIHPKPIYYIKIGTIEEENEQQNKKPISEYFKVFFSIKNQWTYEIATKQVKNLLKNKEAALILTDQQKTYYAEGLRLIGEKSESQKMFQTINVSKLSSKDFAAHVLFYSRLLVDLRQYDNLVSYAKNNVSKLLSAESSEYYIDIGNLLLRRDRYREIFEIIPAHSVREALIIRIEALRKLNHDFREKESEEYLTKYDKDSTIAERTYFSACYDKYKKNIKDSLGCFTNLSNLTLDVEVGGRSRYFIAKILEQDNKLDEAKKFYQSVYLNSPSDYYVFKALLKAGDAKKSVPLASIQMNSPTYFEDLRVWLAQNIHSEINLKEYFKRKRTEKDFGVDPFWKQWEKKLEEIETSATENTKKAMILTAIGYPDLGAIYLPKNMTPIQEALLFEKVGILTDDPYLKYRYIQQYLIKTKKSHDIFTLSNMAENSLYPMPYLNLVEQACKEFNVEPARIYSLMKQESNFHPGVRSPVGAAGLMQVMPATARGLNQVLKISNLDLINPKHSILLGTKFYSQMDKHLNGHFEEIAVAYNAGPGRLNTWKKTLPLHDLDLFVEEIPFKETNGYVKRTRSYYDRYKILLNSK